jgi:hypothetical protein
VTQPEGTAPEATANAEAGAEAALYIRSTYARHMLLQRLPPGGPLGQLPRQLGRPERGAEEGGEALESAKRLLRAVADHGLVRCREKELGGSGVTPLGLNPLKRPPGLLITHLHTMYMV